MKTTTSKYPKTPELDKMNLVKDKSQIIGGFLEQIASEDIYLAQYDNRDVLHPIDGTIEQILARYFEIDLDKCEQERLAILDYIYIDSRP